ncbi:hypothetical protein CLOSTMETH_00945 [[Clostridium] methylpentosum DSM 5476]|uniref:Uncharacterized protein n=1 Tax=[Clostridium] methylpentosum DSM 5476 TaxID=537013 RepID=C0EAT1_9FIRM|nr:hypothetical protein CLOSTMETH_00945 [[Clostridium] methylpentosum DSM 5476]
MMVFNSSPQLFQFFQLFFGTASQNSLMNGVKHIFNLSVSICKLLTQ